MENFNENQPPTKKLLKQAKLSFFKATPPSTKAPGKSNAQTQSQGKKRRNSSNTESPSKSAKLAKPLVSLSNAESPKSLLNASSSSKQVEDNDHEVSSSSEAESSSSGKLSGKCCLMERFVRKLPLDGHQEISSTNGVLDISMEAATDDCDKIQDTLSEKEPDNNDKSISKNQTSNISNSETTDLIVPTSTASKCSHSESKCNEQAEPVKAEEIQAAKEDVCDRLTAEIAEVHSHDILSKGAEKGYNNACSKESNPSSTNCESSTALPMQLELSITEENPIEDMSENLDTSASKNSKSLLLTSTPLKQAGDLSGDLTISPCTPQNGSKLAQSSASSGKRTRKVDSAKKIEREAEKRRLKEEKERQRQEKKRKLEDEKAEKARIKKEEKEAKEKIRQEQKEKLERERLEKEKLKEEERKKRDEEKQKREEEKKKKQLFLEAKQEEKRKKDEEKRLKEEEKKKEEEEKKKKSEKTKLAFQNFFIKSKEVAQKPVTLKPVSGIFIPFELKKDMYLAPTMRRDALSDSKKIVLDKVLGADKEKEVNPASSPTYLEQLSSGAIQPYRTGRILRKNPEPSEMDVEIIHDLETLKKVYHCVKLLQFHTDNRPPYYGTWRKRPVLNARNPWKKDESFFDYEVDSDEEWEEEEPGESLSCSDGEEEKGDDADEEDEDGWMVPHGYLSEDEGCNEDDEITPEKLKLQQIAKAKAWEEELNKKLQATPIVTVGCFFEYEPSVTMTGDVRLLYEFQAVALTAIPISTSLLGDTEIEKPEEETAEVSSLRGCQKQPVPDEAMPDLIRLVHGNIRGIKKLVREFRVFWLKKNNPDLTSLTTCAEEKMNISLEEGDGDTSKTESTEKSKEEGHGCSISKRQLEIKISAMAVREKRSDKKMCWYVHEPVLSQFNLSDLALPNSWVYVSSCGLSKSPRPNSKKSLNTSKTDIQDKNELECLDEKDITPVKIVPKDQRSIMDFTRSKEEMAKSQATLSTKPLGATSTPAKLPLPQTKTPTDKKGTGQRSIMDFAKKPAKTGEQCEEKMEVDTESAPSSAVQVIEIEDSCDATELPFSGKDFVQKAPESTQASSSSSSSELASQTLVPAALSKVVTSSSAGQVTETKTVGEAMDCGEIKSSTGEIHTGTS